VDNYPSMELYAKRMTLIIGFAFLLISAGGFVFYRSWEGLPFTLGAAVTAAVCVLKVFWLKKTVSEVTEVDAAVAVNYIRIRSLLRNLFTLAALVGAGFLANVEVLGLPFLFGAVFGVFTKPIASYSMGFFTRKDYKEDFKDEGANPNV